MDKIYGLSLWFRGVHKKKLLFTNYKTAKQERERLLRETGYEAYLKVYPILADGRVAEEGALLEGEADQQDGSEPKKMSLEELAGRLDELFKDVELQPASEAAAAALTRVAIKSSLVATIELHPAVHG